MAHRKRPVARKKSITIQRPTDNRWINIPTVIGSAKISILPSFAKQLFREGRTRAVGGKSFSTRAAAVKAAGRRPSPGRTITL